MLLLTLSVGADRALAQAPPNEAQIKAAFVYNFLKFVDWPLASFSLPSDPMVVAIIGEGATADALELFLASKQVGERRLAVRRQKSEQPLAGVHAIFVSEDDSRKVRRLLEAAAGASVLSIGEGDDFASHGGVIGLLVEARRVRFDIDADAADAAKLKISSKLLALARVVRSSKSAGGETP